MNESKTTGQVATDEATDGATIEEGLEAFEQLKVGTATLEIYNGQIAVKASRIINLADGPRPLYAVYLIYSDAEVRISPYMDSDGLEQWADIGIESMDEDDDEEDTE